MGEEAHHNSKINRKKGEMKREEEKEEEERKEGKRGGNIYNSNLSEQSYAFGWNTVYVVNGNPFIFFNIKL